jgi:hypothetical protein
MVLISLVHDMSSLRVRVTRDLIIALHVSYGTNLRCKIANSRHAQLRSFHHQSIKLIINALFLVVPGTHVLIDLQITEHPLSCVMSFYLSWIGVHGM